MGGSELRKTLLTSSVFQPSNLLQIIYIPIGRPKLLILHLSLFPLPEMQIGDRKQVGEIRGIVLRVAGLTLAGKVISEVHDGEVPVHLVELDDGGGVGVVKVAAIAGFAARSATEKAITANSIK